MFPGVMLPFFLDMLGLLKRSLFGGLGLSQFFLALAHNQKNPACSIGRA